MGERIKIQDIPTGPGSAWPWDDWKKIPLGEAEEITELLNGRPADRVAKSIFAGFRYHKLRLRVIIRGDRLWIANKG